MADKFNARFAVAEVHRDRRCCNPRRGNLRGHEDARLRLADSVLAIFKDTKGLMAWTLH